MAASIRETFRLAVERILNSWTALRLAVEHGFGGSDSREKAEWMVQAVDQWFAENKDIDPWELEEFLAEVLNNEFDMFADDDSLPQVSKMICGCYKLLQNGDAEGVKNRLDRLPMPALHKCLAKHVNQEVQNDEDDDEEEDPGPRKQNRTMNPPQSHNSLENGGDDFKEEPGSSKQVDSTSPLQSQDSPETMEADADGWVTVGKKGKRR